MIKISVCIGSSCHLKGSYNVINGFQHVIEKNKVSDKVDDVVAVAHNADVSTPRRASLPSILPDCATPSN